MELRSTARRVSLFISHHVATHKTAAERIKCLLESRTERLDVHTCEGITCGIDWSNWILQHIAKSKILLVLVPSDSASSEWISKEVKLFKKHCPRGRLVIIKNEFDPIPAFAKKLQVVEMSTDDLQKKFLEPLYLKTTLTGLDAPLNTRISAVDIGRDAVEIRDAIRGELTSQQFGESLVVNVSQCGVRLKSKLDRAKVHAPVGCDEILNWAERDFTWRELRERAEKDKVKGTFWVREMEEVMRELSEKSVSRVMSSTFRGRGAAAGRIFRPQLTRVDKLGSTPVVFEFTFHEVLVPESVRGPELIGAVYNLLHLAGRMRWEVLNPFLIRRYFANSHQNLNVKLTRAQQLELIGQVSNSLRAIEIEAERQDTLAKGISAFEGDHFETIQKMFDRRAQIKLAIDAAVEQSDLQQLMLELTSSLDLNSQVMEIVAAKFLKLARDDRSAVKQMLSKAAPAG